MQAVEVLRAEHDGVLAVLDRLERAATAAEWGVAVPQDVFIDIQEFFGVFVDRCHHGKEEAELFPRLVGGTNATIVQALAQEHDSGRRLAATYAAAVRSYAPGDRRSGARLARASRDYAAHLRAHIERETLELFPAMEASWAADDDRLVAAFERIEQQQIGAGTHERLHAMIETLPVRIAPWLRTPMVAE